MRPLKFSLALSVSLALCAPALAAPVDLTKKVINYDGKPLKLKENEDATVKDCLLIALQNVGPRPGVTPDQQSAEKLKVYTLMRAINTATTTIDFSAADETMLENALSTSQWPTYIFGQLVEQIDPAALKK